MPNALRLRARSDVFSEKVPKVCAVFHSARSSHLTRPERKGAYGLGIIRTPLQCDDAGAGMKVASTNTFTLCAAITYGLFQYSRAITARSSK